ncbi:MAG: hypothetical protein ACLQVJ_15760 [Syntrophobacteraceae bacterium]
MQKKIFSGMKAGLLVLSVLLLALCLVSMAAAKKPSPPTPPTSTIDSYLAALPNGVPFQNIKKAIELLEADVTALQTAVAALQAQTANIGNFEYLSFSFTASGGGENIPITDTKGNAPTFAAGGKNVRFEVSFVPSPFVPPIDSYIMAALISPGTTSTNFIGTNSSGTQSAGNLTSFPSTTAIAAITNFASLVAETETTFAISTLSTAPAGTYQVKIFY